MRNGVFLALCAHSLLSSSILSRPNNLDCSAHGTQRRRLPPDDDRNADAIVEESARAVVVRAADENNELRHLLSRGRVQILWRRPLEEHCDKIPHEIGTYRGLAECEEPAEITLSRQGLVPYHLVNRPTYVQSME